MLLAHPIHGRDTFRPSGNPATDEPEFYVEPDIEYLRRSLGTDTPEGQRAHDRMMGMDSDDPYHRGIKAQCAYWDRLRALQEKSPRARKRAEERERRALRAKKSKGG
jgi:hypothetical protein